MRSTITRKAELVQALHPCLQAYQITGLKVLIKYLHTNLLKIRIKFPLLEQAAHKLYENINVGEHLDLCQGIMDHHTIGGNVIVGIILQRRLKENHQESFQKASEFIAQGEQWYVSDIIGERVIGQGLLSYPETTLPLLPRYAQHPSKWVVRSLGAGSHYAVKKGLGSSHVDSLFKFLMSLGQAKDHHIKTGIGWAAKTCARFHPELVLKYGQHLEDKQQIGQWFRTKVRIGLQRHQYDQGN